MKASDIYKVGLVNWQSVSKRLQQTDTTGVIEPIELIEEFELDVYDPKITYEIEKEIHDTIGKVRKNREGVRGNYVDKIRPTIVSIINKYKAKQQVFIDTPTPRYYQYNAALIAKDYYKRNDRGWIQWTCGSGKSFGGYWIYKSIREELGINSNLIIIFVPNRQLVVQTHDDWCYISRSYGDNIRSQKVGDVDGNVGDVGKLIRWLQDSSNNTVNLIVSTYQSFNNVSTALKASGIKADLVINDEVHRLAGSEYKIWSKCLLDSEIPARKRLSMTASPIEYTQDSVGYNGMENFNLFGERFHKYLFLDAQFDGYIAPLEILGIEIDENIIERIEYLINKNKDIIQRNLYSEDINIDIPDIYDDIEISKGNPSFFIQLHNTLVGLRQGNFTHPIIYTNSIKRIRMFMACLVAMAPDYGVNIDYHDIFTSEDNINDRIKKLSNQFAKSKIGVVGNVYCLQEGISINEVDSIIMIDPRSSGPAIIQILGRPVRLDKNNPNKIAKILLPIILRKTEEGQIILNNEFLQMTRDWMLNICGTDEDFANLIIQNLSIFTEKSRQGIDVREVLPADERTTSISGRNRILDNNVRNLDHIDFSELTQQLKINTLLSTDKSNNIRRNTDQGKSELLNKKAISFVIALKDKIDGYINNFNSKQIKRYSQLVKTKEEFIKDFSQINNLDLKIAEELLIKNGLDDLVLSSLALKKKNISAAFSGLK